MKRNKSALIKKPNKPLGKGKDEYDHKLKNLIDKIATNLIHKFSTLFQEKNYDKQQLLIDLNKIVKDIDFNIMEYTLYFLEIEKIIIKKVYSIEAKKYELEPHNVINHNIIISPTYTKPKEKVQKIIEKCKNCNCLLNKDDEVLNQSNENCEHKIYGRSEDQVVDKKSSLNNEEEDYYIRKEKLKLLKIKENDEWGLIAKFESYKQKKESEEKKLFEKEKKKEISKILANQIFEKENEKKLKKEDELKFKIKQNEYFSKLEEEEKQKNDEKQRKIIENKKIQEFHLKQSILEKQKKISEEKLIENNILEKSREQQEVEEFQKSSKKNQNKLEFQRILDENRLKIEKMKELKENEKLRNKEFLEQYTVILDKQQEARESYYKNIKDKIKNIKESPDKNSKKRLENEMAKWESEKKFIEEQKKKSELENSVKRNVKIIEMKNTLNSQVEEKKKKFDIEKEFNKRFHHEVVKKSTDEYILEKENIKLAEKEKVYKYKMELDNQLKFKEKSLLNELMNERERKINHNLLDEIHNSSMIK